MAAFCTNCGTPLAEGAGFCVKCGAPRPGTAPAPSAPPVYSAPPQPTPQPYTGPPVQKSGGSGMKIVLIILGVIFVLGAIGVAGVAFVAWQAKNAIQPAAREKGVDLSDFSSRNAYRGSLPDPCSLLTKEEASEIVGTTIERVESNGHKCDYYAHPESDEQRQEHVKQALENMKAYSKAHPNADPADAAKMARESGMNDLTRGLITGANAGAGPYFSIEVNSNGKATIAAMKVAMGMTTGGVKTIENISGIGDEALMGPMDSMFVFTKNGLGVQIDLRMMTHARDRAIAMAQRILTRL